MILALRLCHLIQVLEKAGGKNVRAMDKTEFFMEILRNELVVFAKKKADFLKVICACKVGLVQLRRQARNRNCFKHIIAYWNKYECELNKKLWRQMRVGIESCRRASVTICLLHC